MTVSKQGESHIKYTLIQLSIALALFIASSSSLLAQTPSAGALTITDINPAANTILEDADQGTAVRGIQLIASDETSSLVPVRFAALSNTTPFAISEAGIITLVGNIDFETAPTYTLTVQATAVANLSMTSTASLTINVLDASEVVTGSTRYDDTNYAGTPTSMVCPECTRGQVEYRLANRSISTDADGDARIDFDIEIRTASGTDAFELYLSVLHLVYDATTLGPRAFSGTTPTCVVTSDPNTFGQVGFQNRTAYTVTGAPHATRNNIGIINVGIDIAPYVEINRTYQNLASVSCAIRNPNPAGADIQFHAIPWDQTYRRIPNTTEIDLMARYSALAQNTLSIRLVATDTAVSVANIASTASANTVVSDLALQAIASDADGNPISSTLSWSIIAQSRAGLFAIDPDSAEVTLQTDGAAPGQASITVRVTETASGSQSSPTVITIHVLNSALQALIVRDDNTAPNTIFEDATQATVVRGIQLSASDENSAFALVRFTAPGNTTPFAVSVAGIITLAGKLDFATTPTYTLTVQATAVTNPSITTTTSVVIDVLESLGSITITDSNDEANSIAENAATGTKVSSITLVALDERATTITAAWSIINPQTLFSINTTSGQITLAGRPDFETQSKHAIVVQAVADANTSLSNFLVLTVDITNVLEDLSITDSNPASNVIAEDAATGTRVTSIALTASDEGANTITSASWSIITTQTLFVINTTSGQITLAERPDFEAQDRHTIVVEAVADADRSISNTIELTIAVSNVLEAITITDTDDAANAIPEDADQGAVVSGVRLVAQEGAIDVPARFTAPSNTTPFVISTAGVITLAGTIDFETTPTYTLNVQATAITDPSITVTMPVTIALIDTMEPALSTAYVGANYAGMPMSTECPDCTLGQVEYRFANRAISTDADGDARINFDVEIRTASGTDDFDVYQSIVNLSYNATTLGFNAFFPGGFRCTLTSDPGTFGRIRSAIGMTFKAYNISINNSSLANNVGIIQVGYDTGPAVKITSTYQTLVSVSCPIANPNPTGADMQFHASLWDQTYRGSRGTIDIDARYSALAQNTLSLRLAVANTAVTAATIESTATANTVVSGLALQAIATDGVGNPISSTLTWSITGQSRANLFAIDPDNARVTLQTNGAATGQERITVQVAETASGSQSSPAVITINIINSALQSLTIRDNNPTSNTVFENTTQGVAVSGIQLTAIDETAALAPARFTASSNTTPFVISEAGIITLSGSLDFATTPTYTLNIQATAIANPSITATTSVTINVLEALRSIAITDTNGGANSIAENSPAGTPITSIALAASGGGVDPIAATWSITSSQTFFAIDSASGVITLAASPDFEATSRHTIVVQAAADANASITNTIELTIAITNVLETLTILDSNDAPNAIAENSATGTKVSSIALAASDEGATTVTSAWSITTSQTLFAINSTSAQITLAASPDFEATSRHTIVVQAIADADRSITDTIELTIDITNVLETLTIEDTNMAADEIAEDAATGTQVTSIALTALDERATTITATWSITSNQTLFTINPASGQITLAASPDFEATSRHTIIVQAIADADRSITDTLELTINVTEVISALRLHLKLFLEGPLQ